MFSSFILNRAGGQCINRASSLRPASRINTPTPTFVTLDTKVPSDLPSNQIAHLRFRADSAFLCRSPRSVSAASLLVGPRGSPASGSQLVPPPRAHILATSSRTGHLAGPPIDTHPAPPHSAPPRATCLHTTSRTPLRSQQPGRTRPHRHSKHKRGQQL